MIYMHDNITTTMKKILLTLAFGVMVCFSGKLYADLTTLSGKALYKPVDHLKAPQPFYLPLREISVEPEPFLPPSVTIPTFPQPVVAIIIDDIGYNRQQGLAALALPGAFTYALIPYSPNALAFAKAAAKIEKEVMLHTPMSDILRRPVSKGGLSMGMSREAVVETLNHSIDSLPNVRGVNNHQGSLLTQKTEPMQWVMETIKQRNLYFVDSRTTHKSVAYQTANRHRVPALRRDIFLDHERTPAFLEQQFTELMAIAKRRGYAVGIGHPYPETIHFLSENINRLEANGISLLPVSKMLKGTKNLAQK